MKNFEESIETQLHPLTGIIAVSKAFIRATRSMSLSECKCFFAALTQLRYTEKPKSNVVFLDKKKLAREVLGINPDSNHLSQEVKKKVGELSEHSKIVIDDEDSDIYYNGHLVSSFSFRQNIVRIKFDDDYLSMFTDLRKDYITMWSADIFKLNDIRAYTFYEFLRQHSDTRKTNEHLLTTSSIKKLLGMPKDGKGSYMRGDGTFDRSNFEKHVLTSVCKELMNCKMISLIPQEDGNCFEKVRNGNHVSGYIFRWTVSDHPSVASATEVREIREDPAALKVAKDIIVSKKSPRHRKQPQTDYMQRTYTDEQISRLEKKKLGLL